jgi:hypothetical protein|tara:strand:- start:305 stop:673 length:369 start_codon:yes stop_codon:yes gene_type:complete
VKLNQLRSIIKEELKNSLNEYQDKFKMVGMLVTDINNRNQQEILSDIRSVTGVTVVGSEEPMAYADQDKSQFKSILTVKVDGHPWILKGGFSREKMLDIVDDIKKIQGVKAFNIKDDSISAL